MKFNILTWLLLITYGATLYGQNDARKNLLAIFDQLAGVKSYLASCTYTYATQYMVTPLSYNSLVIVKQNNADTLIGFNYGFYNDSTNTPNNRLSDFHLYQNYALYQAKQKIVTKFSYNITPSIFYDRHNSIGESPSIFKSSRLYRSIVYELDKTIKKQLNSSSVTVFQTKDTVINNAMCSGFKILEQVKGDQNIYRIYFDKITGFPTMYWFGTLNFTNKFEMAVFSNININVDIPDNFFISSMSIIEIAQSNNLNRSVSSNGVYVGKLPANWCVPNIALFKKSLFFTDVEEVNPNAIGLKN